MKIVIDISGSFYRYLKKRIQLGIATKMDEIVANGEPLDELLEAAERHGYYAGYSEAMREAEE